MAFVLQQSWHDDGRTAAGAAPPPVLALPHGFELKLRKGAGSVFTVLIHIVILWVLATRLNGGPSAVETKPPPGAGVVSLSLAPPAPAAAPAAPARAPRPPQPKAAEVDLSAPSEIPPPEWTVSAIASSARPAAGSSPSGAASSSVGSGAGGGVYDPFAGAAPMRRPRTLVRDANVEGLVPAGDESGLRLDERLFEALRQSLARSNPGLRGTVDLALRISPSGLVIDAAPTGGSLAASLGAQVVSSFRGKRLFLGEAGGAVDLRLQVVI